jgi:uncharacterized membrane protein YkvA (DUF1232 family)
MSRSGKAWRLASPTRLATYLLALWKLVRHRDTPRAAKLLAWVVLAYALSPIDLIPDFIPVLGLLDDVILIPLGVALVVRLVPDAHWQACMREAEAHAERLPRLWWGALLIGFVWLALLGLFIWGIATMVSSGT